MAVISEKGKRNLKQSENKPSRGRRLLPGDRLCILLLPTSTTSEYKANADLYTTVDRGTDILAVEHATG